MDWFRRLVSGSPAVGHNRAIESDGTGAARVRAPGGALTLTPDAQQLWGAERKPQTHVGLRDGQSAAAGRQPRAANDHPGTAAKVTDRSRNTPTQHESHPRDPSTSATLPATASSAGGQVPDDTAGDHPQREAKKNLVADRNAPSRNGSSDGEPLSPRPVRAPRESAAFQSVPPVPPAADPATKSIELHPQDANLDASLNANLDAHLDASRDTSLSANLSANLDDDEFADRDLTKLTARIAASALKRLRSREPVVPPPEQDSEDQDATTGIRDLSFSMMTAAEAGQDIDQLFDLLESGLTPDFPGSSAPYSQAETEADREETTALFSELAVGHARPVREFMLALSLGATNRDWLEITIPVVDSLKSSATAMDNQKLADALENFGQLLQDAGRKASPKINGPERNTLLKAYRDVATELPGAFDISGDMQEREPLLVHYQLRQVPDVHKVTIDKLYAAGLGSLSALCRAKAEDIMAMTQLDEKRAQSIVARFQDYWRRREEWSADPQRAQAQATRWLRSLLDNLARSQSAFLRAEARDDREGKRSARAERRAICLEIIVVLIQLGELDLVGELERAATERKVEQLRGFIDVEKASA